MERTEEEKIEQINSDVINKKDKVLSSVINPKVGQMNRLSQ